MNLLFSVKRLGKKRPFIEGQSIEIAGEAGEPLLLREFLERVVRQQVADYNQKRTEKTLFTFFQEHEIEEEAQTGKVRFGAIYNETQADVDKAIETVLLAFQDGLIAVFIDDNQVEDLNSSVTLQENSAIAFVRLTFLTGRVW